MILFNYCTRVIYATAPKMNKKIKYVFKQHIYKTHYSNIGCRYDYKASGLDL